MPYFRLAGSLASLLVTLTVGLASAAPPASAAAHARLAGYAAAYDLSLGHPDVAGSVAGISGKLAIEFADVCRGYTLNQRMVMDITDNDGMTRTNDFSISSWESIDGLHFRFTIQNGVNGEPTESYAGRADLKGPGKAGTVRFADPEKKSLPLPAGTIFPSEHIAQLLETAESGQAFHAVRVFDGSGEDGLAETGGAIGKLIPGLSDPKPPLQALKGVKSWPVRIAYFSTKTPTEVPQYEVGVRLFANGVGGDLLLDYGDFAIRAKLAKLMLAPDPGCKK